MSAYVLDASVTLAWFFAAETKPEIRGLLDRLQTAAAYVPPLWFYEVANVLVTAERRGRTAPEPVREFLLLLASLPIHSDAEPQDALHAMLPLARTTGLTAYDAAYLDLAMRLGLPLATIDKELRREAQKLGVAVLPPS